MSPTGRTPGPWTMQQDRIFYIWPGSRNDTIICEMWGMSTEQGQANARAISKVPEMVALLRELCTYLHEGEPIVKEARTLLRWLE